MFHQQSGSATPSRTDRARATPASSSQSARTSTLNDRPSPRCETVHWTLRYAAAVAYPAVATGLTLLLWEPVLSRNPFALFYAAVMLSAWYGGLAPGMVATACSVWAIDTFLLPSFISVAGPQEFVQVGIFGGVALLISSLNATRKRAICERDALIAREQSARAEAELGRRRSALLADASNLLAAALESPAAIGAVAQRVVPEFADWCVVDVVDPDAGGTFRRTAIGSGDAPDARALAARLLLEHPLPDNSGGVARVIRTGQPELVPAVNAASLADLAQRESSMAAFVELGATSYLTVPLQARGRSIGALSLLASGGSRCYRSEDLRLADDLAHRLAVAIDNARLYRDAQDANRMKDEFLAVVSHELRTPLNAILGWSQLLHNGALDEPSIAQGMSAIERNARSQARIIDDVLDVSRIIQGKLRLEMRPTRLHAVIADALDAVRPAAEAKRITIHTRLDPDPANAEVRGDPERLRQVAWNLLSNAIKFTPEGGRVDVSLARPDDGHVELRVQDTGKGIDPRFLPHVFERFRQADSSSTRAHGGLGLGLAIVRHLVELHGGTVHAESAGPGTGAMFTVRLPLAPRHLTVHDADPEGDASPHRLRRVPTPGTHPELDGLNVLLVEDEPDARELFTNLLEMSGAAVTAVASARDALAAFVHQPPDVLLSDIGMAGEDGYGLIRQIRALETNHFPDRARTPAVAITAFARAEDRRRALASGFQMHVPKPVSSVQFMAAVATLVRNHTKASPALSPTRAGFTPLAP
jgi:signal transduction histidine kinase/CheY-like chemotaxis protein